MKVKINFPAFFIILILAFSSVGYLYSQEAGDTADPIEADDGGVVIVPDDDWYDRNGENPNAVVKPLLQTHWHQGSPFNDLFPLVNDVRPPAECNRLAIAQLMKFHKLSLIPPATLPSALTLR